jgi:hypothetical protein
MAYTNTTEYLGLRKINSQDRSWLEDATYNLERQDLVAKHTQVQSADGAAFAWRGTLSTGVLVNAFQVVPDGVRLKIYLGRANTSDQLIFNTPVNFRTYALLDATSGVFVTTLNAFCLNDSSYNVNMTDNKSVTTQMPRTGVLTENTFVGSAAQFELDPLNTLTSANTNWQKVSVTKSTNILSEFVYPGYKL